MVNDGPDSPMVVDDFKVVDNAKIPKRLTTRLDTAMMVAMILELCRTMS